MDYNKLKHGSHFYNEPPRVMPNVHSVKSKRRPALTVEERQELYGRLHAAKETGVEVLITIYGENGEHQISGVVVKLEPKYLILQTKQLVRRWAINFFEIVDVGWWASDYL